MARRDGQIGVMMDKKKTLYMIGNAHLDIVWLWQWQEGCQEVKATFRSALDRMKEYDDFFLPAVRQPIMNGWRKTNLPCLKKSGKE